MSTFKQWELKSFASKGMKLTPFELCDQVPFDVQRLYWLTEPEAGCASGQHCHFVEQEVFVCLAGSAVAVIHRGNGKEEILVPQGQAIYVPNHVWHGFMTFATGTVMLAISSTHYSADRSDYCEDYDVYVAEHRSKISA